MKYPAAILVACAMMCAASREAAARLNCTAEAVKACKAEAAKLCRDLPRAEVAKCLDDLADDCMTPEVLCKTPDLWDEFKLRIPRTVTREDPMVIAPDDR